MNNKLTRVNVMLNKSLLKEIDKVAKTRLEDRSTAIRQLITGRIKEEKIKLAVEKFQEGNITFREAVAIAGLDYWDFQSELGKRGIPIMQDVLLARKRIEREIRK